MSDWHDVLIVVGAFLLIVAVVALFTGFGNSVEVTIPDGFDSLIYVGTNVQGDGDDYREERIYVDCENQVVITLLYFNRDVQKYETPATSRQLEVCD